MGQFGYWNKILHVNLGDHSTWVEEPGDAFFRRYVGGRGLIAHYLLEYVPKGADPLRPDNILVIAPGVVTGAPVPGAGRHRVGAQAAAPRGARALPSARARAPPRPPPSRGPPATAWGPSRRSPAGSASPSRVASGAP